MKKNFLSVALLISMSTMLTLYIQSRDETKSNQAFSVLDQTAFDTRLSIAKSQKIPTLSIKIWLHNVEVTNLNNTFRELGATSLKDIDVLVCYSLDEKGDVSAQCPSSNRKGRLYFGQ